MVDIFQLGVLGGVSQLAALYTTPISSSYQVLLSPYYTVAAQTTPYKCSFQLFLSVSPSYSCELLLSSFINRQSLLLLTVSATLLTSHFSYYFQVLLSRNIITYSYQLLASTIPIRYFISYSYLLYLHTLSQPKASNFIKKRLRHRCFPVNIAKFLITALLQNNSGGCF